MIKVEDTKPLRCPKCRFSVHVCTPEDPCANKSDARDEHVDNDTNELTLWFRCSNCAAMWHETYKLVSKVMP